MLHYFYYLQHEMLQITEIQSHVGCCKQPNPIEYSEYSVHDVGIFKYFEYSTQHLIMNGFQGRYGNASMKNLNISCKLFKKILAFENQNLTIDILYYFILRYHDVTQNTLQVISIKTEGNILYDDIRMKIVQLCLLVIFTELFLGIVRWNLR